MIGRDDNVSRLCRSQRDGIAEHGAVLPRNGRKGEPLARNAAIGTRFADVVRAEFVRKGGKGARFGRAAVDADARLFPLPVAGGSERLLPRAVKMPRFGQNALLLRPAAQTARDKEPFLFARRGLHLFADRIVAERGDRLYLGGLLARFVRKQRAAEGAFPIPRIARFGAGRFAPFDIAGLMDMLFLFAPRHERQTQKRRQDENRATALHKRSPSFFMHPSADARLDTAFIIGQGA